jgi:hypothetical protein
MPLALSSLAAAGLRVGLVLQSTGSGMAGFSTLHQSAATLPRRLDFDAFSSCFS